MIEDIETPIPSRTIRMMVPTLVGTTRSNERLGIWLMLGATASTSLAQVFFKVGADHSPGALWIALGVFTYISTLFLTLLAYRHGRVSILYPISALSYVVSAAVGSVFFSEDVVLVEWFAVGVILAGIAMLAMDQPREPGKPKRSRQAESDGQAVISGWPLSQQVASDPRRSLDVRHRS